MLYVSMDITDAAAVEPVLQEIKSDAVVHCAAWTAVDLAEDDDKVDKVRSINAGGTKNIAEVCKKLDCKMVYLSTDYVFDGQGTKPWDPDCKTYQPLNVYGQTKLEGELAVSETLDKYFIVRIAWVFGINGKNFIKTMLNVGKTHDTLKVVSDQVGTPTYTYGRYDRNRQIRVLSCDQRGRLHQLVRFYKRNFPTGSGAGTYRVFRRQTDGTAGDNSRIWPVQSKTPVQFQTG